jgi:hypothetical protein
MDRKKKRVLIFNFMMVMGSCIQFNHRIWHINLPEDSDGGDQYRESSLGWEIWCWETRDYCNDHIWPSQCPASSWMESGPEQLNNIGKENFKLNLSGYVWRRCNQQSSYY